MLVNCYLKSEGNSVKLFKAFKKGCPKGYEVRQVPDDKACVTGDIDVTFGVGQGYLRRQLKPFNRLWLSFDKGYNRNWPTWWRMSFCGNYPTDYLMSMECSPDRADAQGWYAPTWRKSTDKGHILFAGSSDKAHCFFDIEFANAYAAHTIEAIKERSKRSIVYRPKPTFAGAKPVPGAEFSFGTKRRIGEDLQHAHVMVTHSSVSSLNALLNGIPAIILGPAVTGPISSRTLDEIENPRCAPTWKSQLLLNNLAYCQWTLEEYAAGIPQEMFFRKWFGK